MFNREKAEYLKKVAFRTIKIINFLEKDMGVSEVTRQLNDDPQLKGINHDRQLVDYYDKLLRKKENQNANPE